jgi:hypothetical protein
MADEEPAKQSQPRGSSSGEQTPRSQQLRDLSEQPETGLAREFLDFLRTNKKWWLAPILLVMLVLTLVALVSLSPAAPFIYTLF